MFSELSTILTCLKLVVIMVPGLSPSALSVVQDNRETYSFTQACVEKTKLNKMPKYDSDKRKIKTNQ